MDVPNRAGTKDEWLRSIPIQGGVTVADAMIRATRVGYHVEKSIIPEMQRFMYVEGWMAEQIPDCASAVGALCTTYHLTLKSWKVERNPLSPFGRLAMEKEVIDGQAVCLVLKPCS